MTSQSQFKRASEIEKKNFLVGLKWFDKEALVA